MRTVEDLSQTREAQKHLSVERICKSTLSDFNRLIDPERLVPVIEALRRQLSLKQAGRAGPKQDLSDPAAIRPLDSSRLSVPASVDLLSARNEDPDAIELCQWRIVRSQD